MEATHHLDAETRSLDPLLGEVLSQALCLVGGERGLVVEFGAGSQPCRLRARSGPTPESFPTAQKALWEQLRGGETPAGASVAPFAYAAPLHGPQGEPAGAILLDRAPADEGAAALLRTLARMAGYCLSHAQLHEAERRRRVRAEMQALAARSRLDEIRVFDKMARAITSILDPDDVLAFIIGQAQTLFNAEAASIALLDPDGQGLTFHLAVGAGAEGAIGQRVRLGQGIAGWVAKTGKAVRVVDARNDSRWYAGVDKQSGFTTRNLMCAPMTVEDRIIGVVEIINRREGAFDENDLQLLEAVSAQVGAALKNARLFRETRRRADELSTLLETGQAINSTLDLQALLGEIAERACRSLAADGCTLYLLEPSRRVLKPVVALGPYSEEVLSADLPITQGISGWVARHQVGRIMNAAHLHPEAFLVPGTPLEPESLLSVPLQTKGETIGVMTISRSGEREFTQDDLRFLTSLAAQASIAMANARLYEAVRDNAARLAALQEIAKAINASLDLGGIIQTVVAQIGRLVPYQAIALSLYDEKNDRFYQHHPTPTNRQSTILEDAQVDWMWEALEQRAPIVRELDKPAEGSPSAWVILVPIVAEQSRLGVLTLKDQRPAGFSVNEMAILAELANHLALAIQNARLYQERERAYRELAEAQQQLVMSEKLRALGQMASGVAHNFNNVLAVVLGRAQLSLRRLEGDDGLRRDLEAIVRAARDGAAIVRRLQEFTRLRPDEKAMQQVDLNDILASVVEITRPRWKDQLEAEGRHVSISVETAHVPPVACNPSELREVLTNMIFNALDAMPHGGEIRLRVGQEGENVFISVEDTGVGMTEEVRSRIFEPFFTTKGPQNSGLGLSTSYGIISRHGGEIRVESQPGVGSMFTIVLPAAPNAPSVEEPPAVARAGRPGCILLIDDEAELCRIIQRALEAQNHRVAAFSSPEQALTAFHATPQAFDLVITDLGMPTISGWDLSATIRAVNAGVPIIIITGWGDRLDNTLMQQYRISAVLAKPFDIEDLTRLVAQTLGRKS